MTKAGEGKKKESSECETWGEAKATRHRRGHLYRVEFHGRKRRESCYTGPFFWQPSGMNNFNSIEGNNTYIFGTYFKRSSCLENNL